MSREDATPPMGRRLTRFVQKYIAELCLLVVCVAFTLLIAWVFQIEMIFAPILNIIARVELFIFSTVPTWGSLLISWLKAEIYLRIELFVLATIPSWWTLLGAWLKDEVFVWAFVKKLPRIALKSGAMSIVKWIGATFLISWLFHAERAHIRALPSQIKNYLLQSRVFCMISTWWSKITERKKKFIWGLVVCAVFIAIGDAMTGIAILMIDIIWEIALFIVAQIWRFLSWVLPQITPGWLSNIFRDKLFPTLATLFPRFRRSRFYRYARWRLRYYKKWRLLKPGLKIRAKVRKGGSFIE